MSLDIEQIRNVFGDQFEHEVEVAKEQFGRGASRQEFREGVAEWLHERVGKDDWVVGETVDSKVFLFRDKDKAMHFKLKWG